MERKKEKGSQLSPANPEGRVRKKSTRHHQMGGREEQAYPWSSRLKVKKGEKKR